MNDWTAIRAHYRLYGKEILSSPKNEWAIDPYLWDSGMLRMTPIESALWADIRDAGAILYPQYPVLGFFVDFANPVAKIAIECDGAAYHLDREKDAARDDLLNSAGWRVYRISGRDCFTEYDHGTHEHGYARRLIQEICDRHGISRESQSRGGWISAAELSAAQARRVLDIAGDSA